MCILGDCIYFYGVNMLLEKSSIWRKEKRLVLHFIVKHFPLCGDELLIIKVATFQY